MLESDELLTVKEVAEFLKIGEEAVRERIRKDTIKATKMGGKRWLIRKDDLAR